MVCVAYRSSIEGGGLVLSANYRYDLGKWIYIYIYVAGMFVRCEQGRADGQFVVVQGGGSH